MTSFDSTNGPSVTMNCPPEKTTWAPTAEIALLVGT
jgi:hypothetical protein